MEILWLGVGTAVVLAISGAPFALTRRSGLVLCGAAALALGFGAKPAIVAVIFVAIAVAVDGWLGRRAPVITRTIPSTLARGVTQTMSIVATPGAGVRVRQPRLPDMRIEPVEADATLQASITALRRGRHTVAAPATRVVGPLGLAARFRHRQGDPMEVKVYPDLPAARRLADAVRTGRFRDPGSIVRGPMGLGTEFELVREYSADDDIRQVNWRATERMGRPMSNQYRVEQDRDVLVVVDCGRLMSAPLPGERTRLDTALDVLSTMAYVADEVGDRIGVIAFDATVLRTVAPRRRGSEAVIEATFDLEPSLADSDYEAAFQRVGGGKRAFVLVLTDLLDEAAATALLAAMPVLARRHVVVVASAADPDIDDLVRRPPVDTTDVYRASVALDVLGARDRTAARLRSVGVDVITARPDTLPTACIGTYLKAKARARL